MYSANVYIGTIRHYPDGSHSAIQKKQVSGKLDLTQLGLEGDEQAEKNIHGGVDRALCHYPREHYAFWQQRFPYIEGAPAFGENMSTLGLTEENAGIGDIFCWGEALIQITQPRSPCHKLNTYMKIDQLSLDMQETGRCGWLYRVIKSGKVCTDSPLELLSHNSDISVAEAIAIAFHWPFDAEQYRRLLGAAGLSASWCYMMQRRLISHRIESFKRRLFKTS